MPLFKRTVHTVKHGQHGQTQSTRSNAVNAVSGSPHVPVSTRSSCCVRPSHREAAVGLSMLPATLCAFFKLPLSGTASTKECLPPAATSTMRHRSGPPAHMHTAALSQTCPLPLEHHHTHHNTTTHTTTPTHTPQHHHPHHNVPGSCTSWGWYASLTPPVPSLPKLPLPHTNSRLSAVSTMVCVPPHDACTTLWLSRLVTRVGRSLLAPPLSPSPRRPYSPRPHTYTAVCGVCGGGVWWGCARACG